ncbi:MAG: glycosyltransferase family 2 protein [Polyangiaceae bacterium]|nr:glycosyltransferase family 2 protein [Polyangiaceae bacterium]
MSESRVSVVMPTYNAERFLRRPVESVLAQSHRELELLVADDGSTDGSVALVEAYARRDPRVRLLRAERNGGVAAARNRGIAAATGRYIAFLDSDDWWHPSKLEHQLAAMRKAGAAIAYTVYQRVAEDGRVLGVVRPPAEVGYWDMLRSNHIGNCTGIYDRRLGDGEFRAIGHEDYAFWLGMLRKAGRAICAPGAEPLAFYLVRNGSVSANKLRAARWQWRIYREVERLGLLASARYMLHYVVHALAKRRRISTTCPDSTRDAPTSLRLTG